MTSKEYIATQHMTDTPQYIKSPMQGTFYRSAINHGIPFVEVGNLIKKGQIIGLIENNKICNYIKADFDGVIKNFELEDGSTVNYHQNILMVKLKS